MGGWGVFLHSALRPVLRSFSEGGTLPGSSPDLNLSLSAARGGGSVLPSLSDYRNIQLSKFNVERPRTYARTSSFEVER
jgi:hypothetical protein